MDGRDSAAPTQAGPADAPAMRSVSSSDLHLIVAGIRIEPELRDDSFVFPLMLPCADLRLMSRSARPYDIGLGEDTRQLGYRVRALTLLCGGQQMPIPLDHPGLVQGFHQVEHNGMRWTDGAASLPDAVFAVGNGPAELVVHGHAMETYSAALSEHKTLLARFESLGDNCEFGLVQRGAGHEPMSLFHAAGTDVARLVLGLCRRFDGLGDPAFTKLEWRDDASEYSLVDPRYLSVHTLHKERIADPAREEEIRLAGCARLRLLRRKLLADIETGRRIFVFKISDYTPRLATFAAVQAALRGIGPAPLLCVVRAATPAQIGQVEALGDGLYVGHIDRFTMHEISHATWRRICEATAALVDAAAG